LDSLSSKGTNKNAKILFSLHHASARPRGDGGGCARRTIERRLSGQLQGSRLQVTFPAKDFRAATPLPEVRLGRRAVYSLARTSC
jgi:hypothetical protein